MLSVEADAGAMIWPSGFGSLDAALTGGFRAGELVLLGAGPGLGKTTCALQVARNLVVSDHSVVYFSFEHDNHSLLERLIVLEAAEIAGPGAVRLAAVRQSFSAFQGPDRMMEGRLFGTQGGVEAIQALKGYSERLHVHRSSGAETSVEAIRLTIEAIREHTGPVRDHRLPAEAPSRHTVTGSSPVFPAVRGGPDHRGRRGTQGRPAEKGNASSVRGGAAIDRTPGGCAPLCP